MSTLIASIDSDIGRAIYRQIPNATVTSRQEDEIEAWKVDVIVNPRPDYGTRRFNGERFDRLFYCIAAENPVSRSQVFQVNCLGAYDFLSHCAERHLKDGAEVMVLTSLFGSIGALDDHNLPVYRMSKAAMNMCVALLAKQYPTINWRAQHPGLVDTKMTKGVAYRDSVRLNVDVVATKLIELLNMPKPFGFYNIDGKQIPW